MKRFRSAARLRGLVLPVLIGLVCVSPQRAGAQSVTGTILGTVKDSSGAVVPGATVNLVHMGTGASRSVVTNEQGEFTAPALPTGNYSVSGEMSGFKKVTLANVHVGVDQRVRADLKLDLGEMTEAVEIQAETPLVQTASSDLSVTVEGKTIESLPLNGRNFVSLTRTIPGVTRGVGPGGGNIDGSGSLAWRASASFSANGQRPRDNNYLLDGVDNNETWLQTVVVFPSVDALDEFKLQTSTYAAEFGRSMGGVVNLQIKSGSNEFHGSGFEFLRNDAFDANNWFNNRAGRPKPEFSQHQFGGTIGGPIIKDKTFFFADYQGMRITQGQTYLSTMPSAAMRRGDFSEINRPIYDPLTGQPFPGNIIPRDRWDPASANVLEQLIPEPNTTGTRNALGQQINNYLINPALTRQDNQFDVKVDHALSQSNRFFVRYSFQKTHRDLPATQEHGDANDTFGAGIGDIKAQSFAFNDTHTFSASWLNEVRVGYSLIKFNLTPIDFGENLAEQMGIPGVNINSVTSAMSRIIFEQNGARRLGSNANQPLITNLGNLQLFDNVTYLRGRHTFKGGASVIFRTREILNADTMVGEFYFSQNQTSNCAGVASGCTVNSSTGFDVASFLLGYARRKNRAMTVEDTYMERRPEWGVYVQDDFRVTPKLTLNMGVRWDVFVPWVEDDNRQSNFDPSTGRMVIASDDAVINGVNVGRYLQTYSKTEDIGPRLGFAYDLNGNGRTTIRGGFGVFWNWGVGGTSSSKGTNQPFLQATDLLANSGANTLPLSTGFPDPPPIDPTLPLVGATRSVFDINYRDQYSMNWNINLQKQLGRDYMVELAYVGTRGRQLTSKTDLNQAPNIVGVTNQNVNRPFFGTSPGLTTVSTAQSLGELDYHAFLFKGMKRFSNGFSALVSYTFGKAIDLVSNNDGPIFTNIFDPGYDRGPADYDVKHTLVASFIYELPFARNHWAGGWQLNGIGYYRSGLALTISQSGTMQSTGLTNNRPNVVEGKTGESSDPSIDQWFDVTAFSRTEPTGTFGNIGRNTLRGPEIFNVDLSLVKNTKIGKLDTELRIETFNVLNHPQFGPPARTFGNTDFGTITTAATPSCQTCGTSERQIQFGVKVRF
jgi:Carboxypeptidase regulatory-like domain